MYWLKISNLALLLGATAWLANVPDWEPLLAFVTALTTYLVQDVRDHKKNNCGKEQIEKDKENFGIYENILSGKEFTSVLNNELSNLRTDMDFVDKLASFLNRASEIEGQFFDKKIQKVFLKTKNKLFELKIFLALHFFVPRDGISRNSKGVYLLYLYPDLKWSDDPKKQKIYKNREKELHSLIDENIDSYEKFRNIVKIRLVV